MPYQIVTDPKTGKVTTVVTGKVYEPKEGETPSFPAAPTPMDLYEAARGFTPQGMLESGVKAATQAAGAGFAELQRTGDLGKAVQASGTAYGEAMQQPAMLSPRLGYNAARDLTQSVLGNLPAAGSRKPGQPDSPILGVIPPLPRIKSTGPVEDVATGFLQGAMAWIPAARAVGLVGRGLTAIPGVASLAQGTRTAAAFMEGAGPVVPLLPKAPTVGKIAVQAAKASLAGAPTGALVDVAGFTPGQQTTVGQVLDWVEKQSGTPLHGMVTDLLKTKPGDTEADARWKEGVGGLMVMGPLVGNAIEAVGYLARAYVHRASVEGKAAPVGEPDPVTTAANRQANVDVATARQQAAQANVDSFDPKPDPADKKATRAWNRKYKKLNEELTAANNAVAEAQALQQQPAVAPAAAAKPDAVAAADQALAEANARFEKAMREMAQPSPGGIADPWATPMPAATAEVAAPGAITPEVVPPGATGPGTGRTKLSEQFRAGMENLGQSLGEYTRTVEGMMARQEQSLQQRAVDLQQRAQELGTEAAAIQGVPAEAAPDVQARIEALGPEPQAPTPPKLVSGGKTIATGDTRGQGMYFHGSAQEIPGDKPRSVESGDYWTDTNIFGNGFYTTDDFSTAGSYTAKGKTAALKATVAIPQIRESFGNVLSPILKEAGATSEEITNLGWRTGKEIPSPDRLREIASAIDAKAFAGASAAEKTTLEAWLSGTKGDELANVYAKALDQNEPIRRFNEATQQVSIEPRQIDDGLRRRLQFLLADTRPGAKWGQLESASFLSKRLQELADNPPKPKEYNPVIYLTKEKKPVNFFDADRQIAWDEVSPEAKALRGNGEPGTLWGEVLAEWESTGSMSYGQMLDAARGFSRSMGYPRGEVTMLFDDLNAELSKLGYGGLTHQGGIRAGGGERLHSVRIYWDPENQLSVKKIRPGKAGVSAEARSAYEADLKAYNDYWAKRDAIDAEAAAAAPTPAPAAPSMSAADEAVLRRALQGKSPEEQTRIIQQMQAGAPPEPPRPPAMYGGPEDPEWAKRWAELNQANQDKLASGEVSLDDLHRLNTYQKLQSASGNQVYTADTEDLATGMAAMAQTTPDIATRTGFEALSAEEKYAFNQRWFDSHGMDWGKNYEEGLKGLEQSLVDYELGALNRAMSMADKKMVEAQYAGARWLNSVGEPGVNASEQLAQLVTAASSAQRMLLVIDNVRRRWGQLGQEMQMRRNYDIPAQGSGQGVVETAINQELQAMPDAFNGLTDKIDPELTAAAQGGEITPNAEIAADALAKSMMSLGVEPKARLKLFRGAFDTTKPLGPDGLLMFRSNNLISSGLTAMTNLGNGLFNLGRLTTSQALGAALHLDFDRAIYAAQMWGTQLTQIANASRLAGHAMKAGQSLFNLEGSTIDAFARIAKEDAAGDQMLKDPKAMTGWSVNTWNMSNEFAQTRQGQLVNKLWQIAGTGASRLSIGLDTFNAALSGYSYERFRHMPRGMELAVERGLPKFSSEAWAYANKYADARTEQAISDVVINGKTLADAALESPDAKKFMDAVNFTDDIYAQMETRTPDEGYRIGKAKGLKGEELDAFAKKYVDEGLWYHKVGDYFVTPGEAFGSGVLGRIGSAPGLALEGLSSIPVVGPVVRLVQPFQRVPANIIKSTMRSTPAAVFVDTWWRDVMSNDVGTRQRAVGEIALGSSALTMMMLATTMGYIRINGGGPLDPAAREKWLKERQMPYSIQFWDSDNGQWDKPVSLRAMEPFATLFGAVGDYADHAASMPTETRNRAGGALLMSLVRMQTSGVLSKTYFQGINELYEAAFDPSKIFTGPAKRDPAARWLQRVLASMVPYSSALRAARRQVDPYARTVEPSEGGWMGFWQETWDEIRNATPGLSQNLPALRDWSLPGAPPIVLPQIAGSSLIPEDAPFLQALWQFTPMAAAPMGQAITDPVQQEMFNLHGKGSIFSGPRASDFGPEMRLTPTELTKYQEMFASVRDENGLTWHDTVSKLLSDPSYVALPDQASSTQEVSYRAAAIQKEIMRYKELAKAEFKATTAKGQVILQNEAKLQGQRDEMNYYERYGVPGASSITTPNALTAPQQQAGQPWSITPGKR